MVIPCPSLCADCVSPSWRVVPARRLAFRPRGGRPAIFPLSDVKPGMKGVAYTIFAGDQVEKVDLEVIGILQNALGPKQDVILVQLLGDKVEQTGVVAGMSGSPVYFDGKLAGALSLKLGQFHEGSDRRRDADRGHARRGEILPCRKSGSARKSADDRFCQRARAIPARIRRTTAAGSGQFLVPIETPLITSGLYPGNDRAIRQGIRVLGHGDDGRRNRRTFARRRELKPGDMVGMDLIRGDLSISSGCTVTTVVGQSIFSLAGIRCLDLARSQMPLTRAHVLMTLASSAASTKIMTTGGTIGTLTQDRTTAVMGTLGPGPPMIPVDVTLETPAEQKKFHFEVIESPQLTPLLVALAAFNGIVGSPAYGEGSTLQMDGTIEMKGHTSGRAGRSFRADRSAGFHRRFMSRPKCKAPYARFIRIRTSSRRSSESTAREDACGAAAGPRSTMHGSRRAKCSPAKRGREGAAAALSRGAFHSGNSGHDSGADRARHAATGGERRGFSESQRAIAGCEFAGTASRPGRADQIDQSRAPNDRLYATLLQSTPTMLVEDKEMPNVPASAINVLDQRQNPGGARAVRTIDGGRMVGGNASGDRGRARADDYREVNPAKGASRLMMRRTNSGVPAGDCDSLVPALRSPNTRALGGESDFSEFEKGTAKGVAIRSDGKLLPAPDFDAFADPESRLYLGAAYGFSRAALRRRRLRCKSVAL